MENGRIVFAPAFSESLKKPSDRIIIALDDMDWREANQVMEEVQGLAGFSKGNSIALPYGWFNAINRCHNKGFGFMADPKFNDIPKTLELSVASLTETGADLITVHASSGVDGMKSAVIGRDKVRNEKVASVGGRLPGNLLAVTVLTSLDESETISVFGHSTKTKVMQFGKMAVEAGFDGLVCSVKEVEYLRNDQDTKDLLLVVPGITPSWANKATDQSRIGEPGPVLEMGADMIVVGRAITRPDGITRKNAAQRILEEVTKSIGDK